MEQHPLHRRRCVDEPQRTLGELEPPHRLHAAQGGVQREVADALAGKAEVLAERPCQRRPWVCAQRVRLLRGWVDETAVHLVDDEHDVAIVPGAVCRQQLGHAPELGSVEHMAARVARRVQQHGGGARGERCGDRIEIQPQVIIDSHRDEARRRRLAVQAEFGEIRGHADHIVTRIDKRAERDADRRGCARRHRD